ncbi:RNA dependent RNA polymerase-domain-containing protein [Phellopilus nigrolimitatus]|nr:RNA dependent RNA polymerase-domain-containing protein [Phellopilus nigrolimitatus]
MEIGLGGIDYSADLYEVKECFAKILHSDTFQRPEEQPLHFKVTLGSHEKWRHNGRGILTVPVYKIGKDLLNFKRKGIIVPVVRSRRIWMQELGRLKNKGILETLRKVPYQDPSLDRERDDKLQRLDVSLRIDKLQFGIWLQQPLPNRQVDFAVEWEKGYTAIGNAQLRIEFDHKIIRIQVGDPYIDYEAHSLVLKFSNIQDIWVGFDFGPYICFELLSPAIVESEWFNRTLTGIVAQDNRKFRKRVGAIDESHRSVGPYVHQVRVVLYQHQDLDEFVHLCEIADLRKPKKAHITADKHSFFAQKKLLQVQKELSTLTNFPWSIAFQIECLLHNGLITTDELSQLWKPIKNLADSHRDMAGAILRAFVQHLSSIPRNEIRVDDFLKFFRARPEYANAGLVSSPQEGLMACHHVTFTPTRMILEGPYVTNSNRVLRRYAGYRDHFMRVDFRDEDRLQYRWDREVDGATFLQERVGGILKQGFDLAGRHFQFLAYSSSALREHAVWFISPFHHPDKGRVDAASIRKEEGNFSDEQLVQPAKYAARLAQAFTATDPSVKIALGQWSEIPDMGSEPYQHTDGVGTISRKLGSMIWTELCKVNPWFRWMVEPSAYQIRFLGYKGVVCVDDQLEGVAMRLRESMRKFQVNKTAVADIEIAKAFHSPGTMYLNRPLIMLLEDLGVKKEAFLDLLEKAVADIKMARNSSEKFVSILKKHGLGSDFGLSATLLKLLSYGLGLKNQDPSRMLNSSFLNELVSCALSSVLRDIKHRCRLPVPKSWTLVGVADEGRAYIQQGLYKEEEVFTLQEGDIFACIQEDQNSEPIYLRGNCNVSRSPTVHPGDVQRVFAVGKPPPDMVCAFRNLVNVVVFPSEGERSFASCLSGGDLDGDIYDICQYHPLFFNSFEGPSEFPPVPKWSIDINNLKDGTQTVQEKVIPYVCDFIVEYINSDVLGLLSDNHLIMADQSSEGVRDKNCIKLAKLCDQAVDYPKNGVPVDITGIPRRLIPYKPDWKRSEDENPHNTDYYRSERAIGYLYRKANEAAHPPSAAQSVKPLPLDKHPIYNVLNPIIDVQLKDTGIPETKRDRVRTLLLRYYNELRYICATHTLSDRRGTLLTEAEIVVGTILAQCSQHRWRKERIYRMRLHSLNLVKEIKAEFIPEKLSDMSVLQVKRSLEFGWTAWKMINETLASPEGKNIFGMNSFSLIALGVVFDCLEHLRAQ